MDRWSGVRGHHTLPTHFRYSTQAPDRFTNCPVDEDQLYRNDPGELERFRADCLAANGVWHQIRTIIYARREFAGFFGVFRAKGDRPFARREHTLMGALLPHARSWLSAVRLFHQAVDGTAVAGVLDALDEPAFLTTLSGRVVHANPAALHRYPEPPSWLPALARRGAGRSQMATTHRIETDGAELLFIRLRIAEPRIDVGSLPAYLQVVAELMSSGASDKDIAFELDVSVATARTYAGRVLERLGLHDRRQLMRRG